MMETEVSVCVEHSPSKECKRSPNDQETPGFQLDSRSYNGKIRQGRLLFDTPSTTPSKEMTPLAPLVVTDKSGNGQPQAIVLLLQASPPNQTQNSSTQPCVITPPNGIPLSVTPSRMQSSSKVVTTPTAQTTNPGVTTPTLSKSCPPKPKLTKEERQYLRQKREREREEAKVRREELRAIREEERQIREQEKRERQLKREREARERQERKAWEEKMKEQKREKKEAEKKKAEEERKKAEQKKEEAKNEKLRIAQKNKERLMTFFVRKPKEEVVKPAKQEYSFITPFSLKANMTLASRPKPPLESTAEFDNLLQSQDSCVSVGDWVKEPHVHVHVKDVLPRIQSPSNSQDDDVIEVKPAGTKINHPFKLLQFHKNYRPAYYGTWRKRSSHITPRNPFKRDEDLLDYSVDSDEEWEEEDPGESISDSEGEEEGDGDREDDEDEEDDGFFVPHGYLSDGEGDDELPAGFDPTGNMEDSENKRKKMADKAKAWEAEFARKCQPLKPVRVGCTWTTLTDNLSKDQSFLQQFAAVALTDLPLSLETKKDKEQKEADSSGGSSEHPRMPVPEEAVPDLIRIMHKSSIGVARIIKTFRVHWGAKKLQSSQTTPITADTRAEDSSNIPKSPNSSPPDNSNLENASRMSKRQIERKIHEIAVKASRPPTSRPRWYVHDEVLAKYNIDPDNFTPLTLHTSPQDKANSDLSKKAPTTTQSTTHCALHDSTAKKTDGILSLFASLGKLPLTSPQAKMNPKQTTAATQSSTNCVLHKSTAEKRKDGILSLFASLGKSPDSPSNHAPQPKRAKLELHVDRQTPPCTNSVQPTPPGKDSVQQTPQSEAPKQNELSQSEVSIQSGLVTLGKEVRQEKRDLDEPVSQSAAKRLCLEDTTNKTAVRDEAESACPGEDKVNGSLMALTGSDVIELK